MVKVEKPTKVLRKFVIPAMNGLQAQVVEAVNAKEAVKIYTKNLTK